MDKKTALDLLLEYVNNYGYPISDGVVYTEEGKGFINHWTYEGLKEFILK